MILRFIFLIQPRLQRQRKLQQPKQLRQLRQLHRHVRDKSSFIFESYLFNTVT